MSTKHAEAANRFIENKERETWHNETLWFVREKRDRMAMDVPEWEQLRELAGKIKMHTITHLDTYARQFAEKAEANGVIVHWAKDAEEHNEIIFKILTDHGAKKLVKSKSMLAEECELNPYLIKRGIDAVESDLGERILQLKNEPPSHIVLPAIHLTRQQVGKLFEEKLHTEKGNSDPTYLTHAARQHLRNEFLTADASMTGCNFAVADTGEVVVCTNEGNADMGTSLAKLHIVTMGIEKIVPNHKALSIYTRLLARSATGQPTTTYTSHYRKARSEDAEMHIVIVDNGRSEILGNDEHIQALKCIRCGACMNTCPVYRRSGGYSYTYFIPGPIGINLGMLKAPEEYYDNVSACSLCYSCNNVCPVKIDLADQIYRWRQNLDLLGRADKMKKIMSDGMKFLFVHPSLYNAALNVDTVVNHLPRFMIYNGLNDWGKGREMPVFAKESFTSMWKKGKVKKSKK
ncbi:L-lactate dehydrogenase complex protein LldF [Dysgonomonas sp. PH5-45]|uniref:lactate utilization protein B n=1 Tax=unclassified Dysgonomonas TaxID=2630389 RepID=UPI0024765BF4|nr:MULTISPECIES: lactate utilization protein B [unclassified Dysgonomonas]MDH6355209.1 L-lactate dehydrogenase complex protein LldF [Dysgonomonas sp. PH5-45]MDH6388065.1 L-lactate dehydrogenase complex protein LldF [Dysgonomonas sp. PH5-37]